MPVVFKPVTEYSDKYRRRASVAAPDYKKGVAAPKRPYAAAAVAGEPNFASAMTAVIAEKRRSAGITKAGDAKWLEGCNEKGAERFPKGVDVGSKYYETNLAPIHQKAAAAALNIRGPVGAETNYQNAVIMAKAFRTAAGKR